MPTTYPPTEDSAGRTFFGPMELFRFLHPQGFHLAWFDRTHDEWFREDGAKAFGTKGEDGRWTVTIAAPAKP